MAFRVCCSCKTPLGPSEGFVSRLCRVTQTLGTVIGTESYFWSPVSGYTDKWDMSFTAPSTGNFLLEGFRVEWYGPTENGQKFNGAWPLNDTSILANIYAIIRPEYGLETLQWGGTSKTTAVFAADDTYPVAASNLSSTKVPLGGHISNEELQGIAVGRFNQKQFLRASDSGTPVLPSSLRVKHWRMVVNGSPVGSIVNGYHPDSRTAQTLLPISDVSTSTWSASTGTDFYALVDEDTASANTADYIWSPDNSTDAITFALSDFTYTGGYNNVTLSVSATMVNAAGTPTAMTGRAISAALLYNGEIIATVPAISVAGNTTWNVYSGTFRSLTDVTARTTQSCSYIPVDADPTKFRVRITASGGPTQRVALAAINVKSTPFNYSFGTSFGSGGSYDSAYWPIEAAYRIPWRKNARLGFDIWCEAVLTSGASWSAALGQHGASTSIGKYEGLTSTAAHGTLGIRTTFMPEYDVNAAQYSVKYLNGMRVKPGNWNLSQNASDDPNVLTFRVADYIFANDRPGFRRTAGSIGTSGIFLTLLWNREIPEVLIDANGLAFSINGVSRSRLRYIPEDSGDAIDNFYYNHSTAIGNIYVNVQTPGGIFKQKGITKFVLEAPCQTSTTNSFSPEPLQDMTDFPTELEVRIAYPPQTYAYYESDTWECPSNVTSVTVRCWGGGGGGGATDDYSGSAAGGGGGGAFSSKVVSVTPGTTYTITVGSGGAGGVDGNINGQAGGDSWFVDAATVMAKGGSGGQGATLDDDEAGGVGGAAASGVGTTKFSGGNGADGLQNTYGGGGGASAGTNNNGAAATNATGATGANNGGDGGDGTTTTAGAPPGGGGGGAKGTAASDTILPGGAGGGGLVTLRY